MKYFRRNNVSDQEVSAEIQEQGKDYKARRAKVLEMAEYFVRHNWNEDQPRSPEEYMRFVEGCFLLSECFYKYSETYWPEVK